MATKHGIEIGDEVRCRLNGYRGIAYAVTKWLTGCDTVLIKPDKLDKNGNEMEGQSYDVTLVKVVKKGVLKAENPFKSLTASPPPGGPHEKVRETRR